MKTGKPTTKPVDTGTGDNGENDITLIVRQEFIRRVNEALRRIDPSKELYYEADIQGKPYLKRNNRFSQSGFMLETAAMTLLLVAENLAVPIVNATACTLVVCG